MLSVVRLLSRCWKDPDTQNHNMRSEDRRKRTWTNCNTHMKQLPLLANTYVNVFRSSVWWHLAITVAWQLTDLMQKKISLGWQGVLMSLDSSISAHSQKWIGYSLLFTHQDNFIPLSLKRLLYSLLMTILERVYCSRIIIKYSSKSGFYVIFCTGYLKHLFLIGSIGCFFPNVNQKDLSFEYT